MEQRVVRVGLEAGAYIALLGFIAWGTGYPFIFPSLGPTAFALTLHPKANTARTVLGGHLWGVVCGLLAYHALASGLTITSIHASLSASSLWLAASGALIGHAYGGRYVDDPNRSLTSLRYDTDHFFGLAPEPT